MRVFAGIDADMRGFAVTVIRGREILQAAYVQRSTVPVRQERSRMAPSYDALVRSHFNALRRLEAVVYLEDAFEPKTRHNKVSVYGGLCRVQGEVRCLARIEQCAPFGVEPCTWQALLFGFSEPREDVKAASVALASGPLRRRLGREPNEHQCDAYCIALAAQRYHDLGRLGVGETVEMFT